MVKLVEYDIVFIKRDQERRVHSSTQLVTANMTGESFGAWMIAAYLQSDAYTRHVEVHPTHVITHDDKKYLRVSYTVKSRWPREKEEYEKDQAEALRQLAAAGMVHTEVLARQTGMLDEFRRMGVDVLQKQTDALEDVSEQLKDGLKQLDETLNKRKR
jgi:hypothetical protein